MSKPKSQRKAKPHKQAKAATTAKKRRGEPVALRTPGFLAEQAEHLRQLMPQVFTEGKIDVEKLRAAVGDTADERPERYAFTWAGKRQSILELQKPTWGTLVPAKDESINFDTTRNIFIEGENLEVLKLLYKAYFGRVKMIFTDPPYNTGNDFVYRDDFADPKDAYLRVTGQKDAEGNSLTSNPESSGRYHSAWLSMMYPRLFLARQLLREDGVIFVSIDDHEVHNLTLMMNEIFGEENFIGQFVVNSSPSAIDYGHLAKMHDYVLFYAKSIDATVTDQLPEEDKEFKYQDKTGQFNIYPLYNGNVAFNPKTRPNLFYPFYLNPSRRIEKHFYAIDLEPHKGWVKVLPVVSRKDAIQRVWRWGKDLSRKNLNGEIVGYRTEDGEYRVVQKTRHTGKMIRSMQIDKDISTRRGTAEVEELFGKKVFPFPKSVELVRRFIAVSVFEDDIILDFFGGSGTTAHAVLNQNNQDGGKKRFILVQMPEPTGRKDYPTIADIGKERVRRVIKKLSKQGKGKLSSSSKKESQDLGFAVFTLVPSNFKPWVNEQDATPDKLAKAMELFNDPLADKWKPENVIYEVAVKEGFSLSLRIKKDSTVKANDIFIVTDAEKGQTFRICLDDDVKTATVKELKLKTDDLFICRDVAINDKTAANLALQCRLKTI